MWLHCKEHAPTHNSVYFDIWVFTVSSCLCKPGFFPYRDLPNNILTVLQPNALENYTSLRTLWVTKLAGNIWHFVYAFTFPAGKLLYLSKYFPHLKTNEILMMIHLTSAQPDTTMPEGSRGSAIGVWDCSRVNDVFLSPRGHYSLLNNVLHVTRTTPWTDKSVQVNWIS